MSKVQVCRLPATLPDCARFEMQTLCRHGCRTDQSAEQKAQQQLMPERAESMYVFPAPPCVADHGATRFKTAPPNLVPSLLAYLPGRAARSAGPQCRRHHNKTPRTVLLMGRLQGPPPILGHAALAL